MSRSKKDLENNAYRLAAIATEKVVEAFVSEAQRLEETGNKNDFRAAQKIKIANNKLTAITQQMRNNYPHLFKS
jgi:hypothetical protein